MYAISWVPVSFFWTGVQGWDSKWFDKVPTTVRRRKKRPTQDLTPAGPASLLLPCSSTWLSPPSERFGSSRSLARRTAARPEHALGTHEHALQHPPPFPDNSS